MVASAGSWPRRRVQLSRRLLRTSRLSTTHTRKTRGPWGKRGHVGMGATGGCPPVPVCTVEMTYQYPELGEGPPVPAGCPPWQAKQDEGSPFLLGAPEWVRDSPNSLGAPHLHPNRVRDRSVFIEHPPISTLK